MPSIWNKLIGLSKRTIWQIYAPIYDSILILEPYTRYLKECATLLDLQPNQLLLDVGCGTGNFLIPITTGQVYAVDYSPNMLSLAKLKIYFLKMFRNPDQEIYFIRLDANEKLPIANEVFDCVVSLSSIHSFTNPKISVSEMLRVLRPGGRILLTVPLPVSTVSIIKEHLSRASFPRLLASIIMAPVFIGVLAVNLLQERWGREGEFKFLTTDQVLNITFDLPLEIIQIKKCFSKTYTLLLARKL